MHIFVGYLHEGLDLLVVVALGVHQDGVAAGVNVGVRSLEGLVEAPSGDERLHARNDLEVGVLLRVLAGSDLAGELLDVSELLSAALEQRVSLREDLVLDAHALLCESFRIYYYRNAAQAEGGSEETRTPYNSVRVRFICIMRGKQRLS